MPQFSEADVVRDAHGKFSNKSTKASDAAPERSRVLDPSVEPVGGWSASSREVIEVADEIRVTTDADGLHHVEVDVEYPLSEQLAQTYDDDGNADGMADVALRGELIESYARDTWGANLDNARDWDDDQRMTFTSQTAGDEVGALNSTLDRMMNNGSNGSLDKFDAEMSGGMDSSGLRRYLDRCDAQIGQARTVLSKSAADEKERERLVETIRSKMAEAGPRQVDADPHYARNLAERIVAEQ